MEAKEYIYTKMFYNNKISYMKIIKHGELWAYDDFVVSGKYNYGPYQII